MNLLGIDLDLNTNPGPGKIYALPALCGKFNTSPHSRANSKYIRPSEVIVVEMGYFGEKNEWHTNDKANPNRMLMFRVRYVFGENGFIEVATNGVLYIPIAGCNPGHTDKDRWEQTRLGIDIGNTTIQKINEFIEKENILGDHE